MKVPEGTFSVKHGKTQSHYGSFSDREKKRLKFGASEVTDVCEISVEAPIMHFGNSQTFMYLVEF